LKLYLVRHGQSTGNIGGTLMGQSDHPLTALGVDQARAAAERLAPLGPMPVYSSDLPRARATAEHIAAAWTGGEPTMIVLDPRLREISLGDYEGRPWQEFEADTELTAAFASDPYRTAVPNGESLEHLETRVHAAICDVLAGFGLDDSGTLCVSGVSNADASATVPGEGAALLPDDTSACLPETMDPSIVATGLVPLDAAASACIVSHDGPIRAILNHYLGVPAEKWWTLSTTHGGVSLLEFAAGYATIRFVNATGHLGGLQAESYVPEQSGEDAAETPVDTAGPDERVTPASEPAGGSAASPPSAD